MKNTLLTSLLAIAFGTFLTSCEKSNTYGTSVSMRSFVNESAESISSQYENQDSEMAPTATRTNKVLESWNSTVFKVVDGKEVACDCDLKDFEISQIFLKPTIKSDDHTFLFQNDAITKESHVFNGDDVIGIDMNYQGEYVRMSDLHVFNQEGGVLGYSKEQGVNVFYNEETGSKSAAFVFPIVSAEDQPTKSITGLWMRVVVDFY